MTVRLFLGFCLLVSPDIGMLLDYYQCLPASTTTTSASTTSASTQTTSSSSTTSTSTQTTSSSSTTSTATSTTSASSTSPTISGGLPFVGGVNMAGYDFTVYTNGSFTGTGTTPPASQFAHFASQGVNIFRIPFAWQLMTPTLGGTIDSSFFSRYDSTVQTALSSGSDPYVIIDLHNYARWNGGIINQGGPTDAQFTSIWSQLAAKYQSNPKIIFGVMNEPHDLNSITTWVASVQNAVNAIRAAGATSQYILIPAKGSSWSSAAALPTEAGPALAQVTDPAGGNSKLIFDVHKYLDSDNSGTHADCVTSNVDVLTTLVQWLQANGNRQALLSETGGGNTQSCYTDLYDELAFVKANSANIAGFTVWSAGAFDTTYVLTLTPNADGSDQPLWTQAVDCKTMAPKPRNLNPSGLGRAIINRKVKDARRQQESGLYTSDLDSSSRLKSVTQERDLDEFLNTAQLAGTDFTAGEKGKIPTERRNVKVIQQSVNASQNPYLLSEQEERNTLKKHSENKQRLRVPRRPSWTKKMTTEDLDKQEKAAFLDWRRGLAQLQEEENFLLTPFERNLEVWRQLWRVLERSQLIVQIVDARNPLRFRCEDLENYVQDVEGPEGESGTGKGIRKSLLLINKADLLTVRQRRLWADFFDSKAVRYAFFSAANATALQQARREAVLSADEASARENDSDTEDNIFPEVSESEDDDESGREISEESSEDEAYFSAEDNDISEQDPRVKILSVLELEDWLLSMTPDLTPFSDASGKPPSKLTVGLVGYPNVGKSSTINSLLGEKKVSVSSTPGKTKHFQTIHLSDSIVLCDCPGLVFPQFATTKAELVCDGVLPIDQLREYTGPASLLAQRFPKEVLEATYGLSIKVTGIEEGGDGKVRADNFLIAYAIARGYTRSGQGNPDEARSARYVLKDYVNGKLLYCHPPPGVSADSFNQETYEWALHRAAGKKRAPVTRVGKAADTFVATNSVEGPSGVILAQGTKSRALDHDFFEHNATLSSRPFIQSSLRHGEAFTRATMYPHQNSVANDGTLLRRRQTPSAPGDGKKHFKIRRTKQRSGKGYD
ncbi:hypothetical protein H0H92_001371 [Tricholoma furcatifolium]|nr:hypothetical protein H0H92_001371 [Tricholoma furcatifolium]